MYKKSTINQYVLNTLIILALGGATSCFGKKKQKCNSLNAGAMYTNNTGAMQATMPLNNQIATDRQSALRETMEKLWEEHVLWDRQVIVSSVAKLGDVNVASLRLLKNQEDIGNAIVPFYGQQAGAQLTRLLKEHVLISANVIKATLMHNTIQANNLIKQLYANAATIAQFLSSLNPNWNRQELNAMLNEHVTLANKELQLRLQGNWEADIANYNRIFDQANMLGKILADGIMKQFQNRL